MPTLRGAREHHSPGRHPPGLAPLRGDGDAAPPGPPLRLGALVIDPATWEAWHDQRPLRLTRTEARLLAATMRRPGGVVPAAELARDFWPDEALALDEADRRLYVHVSRLRGKLPPAWGYRIARLRKRGYVLLADGPG